VCGKLCWVYRDLAPILFFLSCDLWTIHRVLTEEGAAEHCGFTSPERLPDEQWSNADRWGVKGDAKHCVFTTSFSVDDTHGSDGGEAAEHCGFTQPERLPDEQWSNADRWGVRRRKALRLYNILLHCCAVDDTQGSDGGRSRRALRLYFAGALA